MSWVRNGLVTLTNGSRTVTGAGTTWVGDVLPGGIFVPSAGGTYEVERAVSDTELLLVKPYTGASAAGVEYGIAPTQGHIQDLALQVAALLGQLGPLKDAWTDGQLLVNKGLEIKGVHDAVEDLPMAGNTVGDVRLVGSRAYAWAGTSWADAGEFTATPELNAIKDEVVQAKAEVNEKAEGVAADAEAVALNKTQFEDRVYPGVYSTAPTAKPHSGLPPAEGDLCMIIVSDVPYEHRFVGGGWLIPNIDATQLALPDGAARVGFIQQGPGSVVRTALSKAREAVSIRDKGAAVDGVTDDSVAIQRARDIVSNVGGAVIYGGKTFASGYWENLAPIGQEWIRGSATDYKTDVSASKPLTSHKVFTGTPQAGAGFAGYAHRIDVYTKAGIDVASTVGFASVVNSLSSNAGGAATANNTNQVAILANASAQTATASAPVTAINAIASSAYTGSTWQPVVGCEVDVSVANPPGFFGQASKSSGIGYSAILSGSSVSNATVAFASDTSKAGFGWLFGAILSGTTNAGLVVARNTVTPTAGVWVSAASTYGVYVGAKPLFDLGPGKGPAYDVNHNPAVGIALGQIAAVSGRSHKLRFAETNGSGAELTSDMYRSGGALVVEMNGTAVLKVATNGAISIGNNQVLGPRITGYLPITGTIDRGSSYDTSTITLVQLARRVAALQADITTMGQIGPTP